MAELNEIVKLHSRYVNTFNSEDGKYVLDDLKKLCFYDNPIVANDREVSTESVLVRVGMHRVIQRIINFMKPETFDKLSNMKGTE